MVRRPQRGGEKTAQMVRAAQLEVLKKRAKRPAVGDVRAFGLAGTVMEEREPPLACSKGATRVEHGS